MLSEYDTQYANTTSTTCLPNFRVIAIVAIIPLLIIIRIRILLLEYATKSRPESRAVIQVQQVGLTRPHHARRGRLGKPLPRMPGPGPVSVHAAELIAYVVVEEGINALLPPRSVGP